MDLAEREDEADNYNNSVVKMGSVYGDPTKKNKRDALAV